MGIALQSHGAGNEAVQFLERWQFHHPDDFWLSFHLGIALLRRNRAKEALRYLTAAVSIRKADWRQHTYLGVAYGLDKDWEKAIAAYRRAHRTRPECRPSLSVPGRNFCKPKERRRTLRIYFGRPANLRLPACPR